MTSPIQIPRHCRLSGVLLFAIAAFPTFSEAIPFPGRLPANKLTASDAEGGDQFATSVASSEDYIVVGSIFEDGVGMSSDNFGAVYVYDARSGVEVMKLQASDPGIGDRFGHSVAISGNLIVVGALFEDGVGMSSDNFGAAYVFDLTTGEELFKLQASDPALGDRFGESVAISGRYVVVGSQFQDHGGASNAQRGAVYFFDLGDPVVPNLSFPKQLEENEKIIASDSENGDQFGNAVAISGDVAIVGAFGEDGAGSDRGAAYAFLLPSGEELWKLTAADAVDGDRFGKSVAMEDDLALVGADAADGGGSDRGAAYFFDLETGIQLQKIVATDAEDGDNFGTSVALAGGIALVGAPNEDGVGGGDRGALYAFDAATGMEVAKFTATDAIDGDRLGQAAALSGGIAAGGAPTENGAGGDSGAAYVFQIPLDQPDCRIGTRPFTGVGDGLHNATGAGQGLVLNSRRLSKAKAWVTVENDGSRVDDYTLAGSAGDRWFGVGYYQVTASRRTNVTAAVIVGTHRETNVVVGERGRLLCVELTPSRSLLRKKKGKPYVLRKTYAGGVSAVSDALAIRTDRVGLSVRTQ